MKANIYIVPAAMLAAIMATAPVQAGAKNPPVIKGQCSTKPRNDGKPPVITGQCSTKPAPQKPKGAK